MNKIIKTIQENPGKSLLITAGVIIVVYLIVKAIKKMNADSARKNVVAVDNFPTPTTPPVVVSPRRMSLVTPYVGGSHSSSPRSGGTRGASGARVGATGSTSKGR